MYPSLYRPWNCSSYPLLNPRLIRRPLPVRTPFPTGHHLIPQLTAFFSLLLGKNNYRVSGLILIFVEVPLLLRICPTSPTFDNFIRRFTTNYMRAAIYGTMSLIQWLSIIADPTSLIAAAIVLLLAAVCYAIAGFKGQGFVGSKTLGGHGVAQMIV